MRHQKPPLDQIALLPTPARWAELRALALAHPMLNDNDRRGRTVEKAETRLPGGWTVLISANN